MNKIIAICGKICSGKTYYANKLKNNRKAIILSCDEITSMLFDNNLGASHDLMASKIQSYLLKKSLDIIDAECDVILDWGFWSKKDRENIKEYYKNKNILIHIHYLDIDDESWRKNIKERNKKINENIDKLNYFIDEGLINQLNSKWETPTQEEIDFILKAQR